MTTTNYAYPVGDFLSGFSEDNQTPCEYELECQRMTIRGVQFLDANQDVYHKILAEKNLTSSSLILEKMIDFIF
jgi:hypothetical protein